MQLGRQQPHPDRTGYALIAERFDEARRPLARPGQGLPHPLREDQRGARARASERGSIRNGRGAGDARTHPPHWSFHLPVVFGTGGIMNATIELLIVALCWLAVLGVVAAIIVAAVIG